MNPPFLAPQFYDDYCPNHPDQILSLICLDEVCESYLTIQCMRCHQLKKNQNSDDASSSKSLYHNHEHKHCSNLQKYVTANLYPSVLRSLTIRIRTRVDQIKKKLDNYFDEIVTIIQKQWYSCISESCTKKQCVNILEIPAKMEKIEQTARIKDQIINFQLSQLMKKIQKEIQKLKDKVGSQMKQLGFKESPEKWKFDGNSCHPLLNISPSLRTIDKKSQIPKFCLGILNQPITPYKNQIKFTINSQNLYSKYIILGLCDPFKAFKNHYELPLLSFEPSSPTHPSNKKKKKEQQNSLTFSSENIGLYGIYQASNYNSMNNAYSIHSSNSNLNYKQIVGWNFGSGDVITIGVTIQQNFTQILNPEKGTRLKQIKKAFIWFRKNAAKQKFQLQIDISNGLLYPFVALYASGDKVTVDPL